MAVLPPYDQGEGNQQDGQSRLENDEDFGKDMLGGGAVISFDDPDGVKVGGYARGDPTGCKTDEHRQTDDRDDHPVVIPPGYGRRDLRRRRLRR